MPSPRCCSALLLTSNPTCFQKHFNFERKHLYLRVFFGLSALVFCPPPPFGFPLASVLALCSREPSRERGVRHTELVGTEAPQRDPSGVPGGTTRTTAGLPALGSIKHHERSGHSPGAAAGARQAAGRGPGEVGHPVPDGCFSVAGRQRAAWQNPTGLAKGKNN